MTTAIEKFKASQREAWALFGPLEAITTEPAGQLVRFAAISPAARVLDVGCGTGVVAISAAQLGAQVSAIDICPALLERAHENASIAQVEVEFCEGDVEALPFSDNSFDFVVSQFGHMFAPRPELAIAQMLRVLKPGGVLAFSTWPPEMYTGHMFALVAKYMPPPEGVAPPPQWGDPNIIKQRLGSAVRDILFDRQVMHSPSLSSRHSVAKFESTAGPIVKLREKLEVEDPKMLDQFRDEFRTLIERYRKINMIHQHYLMTRAIKL